jgi:uncharacterized membrane protein
LGERKNVQLRAWLSSFAADREGPGWARMTYNYLRLGMLVAVVALATSIIQEYYQPGVHCFLGSVSGYYYTPVRPIFIAVMVLIGFALIVIKGRNGFEDLFLTLAGIMAPVVAFIPTSDDKTGVCRQAMLDIRHYQPYVDDGFVPASINNNLHAFLYAGYTAVAVLLIAFLIQRRAARRQHDPSAEPKKVEWLNLWIGLALAIAGSILLRTAYDWVLDSHAYAALAMFGFLALAAITNFVLGIKRGQTRKDKRYAWTYGIVGGLMLLSGIAFVVYRGFDWSFLGEHVVLYIEAAEIFLFVAFWVAQTIQRWNQGVGPPVTAGQAARA